MAACLQVLACRWAAVAKIEFAQMTPASHMAHNRWYASMTRAEVIAYAERKMMPVKMMLASHKKARRAVAEFNRRAAAARIDSR